MKPFLDESVVDEIVPLFWMKWFHLTGSPGLHSCTVARRASVVVFVRFVRDPP